MRKEAVKFVTKEEFDEILNVTKQPPKNARQTAFPEWFPLVLRVIFATGCRPSEVVGTHGRPGVDPKEALNLKPQSRIKRHPGMTPGDVLPNFRIKVHGKHTTPKGRTDDLKERVVLCADGDVYRELRALADERLATHTSAHNLFLPDSRDGKEALWDQMRKLQLRLPAKWSHFSARWLRHSHAIHAIRSGIDLVSVQRQLGHENLMTTAIYLRYAGMDDARYLQGFGVVAKDERRDCPSCGFSWVADKQSGAIRLDDRIGAAMRRSRA